MLYKRPKSLRSVFLKKLFWSDVPFSRYDKLFGDFLSGDCLLSHSRSDDQIRISLKICGFLIDTAVFGGLVTEKRKPVGLTFFSSEERRHTAAF